MYKPKVVILSPALDAVSGVSTHANLLFASPLAEVFDLLHFQVGSEGRQEEVLHKFCRLFLSPFKLALMLLRYRPHIVHLNTSLDAKAYWRDWSYLVVAKLFGAKVVNQIHGGALPRDFFARNAFLTWLLCKFFRLSDVVTILTREEYQAYTDFAPQTRIVHIPNAIDPMPLLGEIPTPDHTRALKLVYVGRLARGKGLFEAVAAVAALCAEGHRLSFDIAGNGADAAALRDNVHSLGMDEVVHFLGPVFGAKKHALWQTADVFVFPTYAEGLPYALLEAMAAGTPAVACPVGAIPDVMQDGVHGFFVPPRDIQALVAALARLDDERELLYRMALAGRQRVLEHYTMMRLAEDFRRLYTDAKGLA